MDDGKMKTLLEYLTETKNQSKNALKTMIQNGAILVDGVVVTKANFPVSNHQEVIVKPKPIICQNYEIPILYEDKDLIVVDKPAGLLTIATDKEKEQTVYHFVSRYVYQKSHQHIFILHRLDKETSGILVFAKNEVIKNWMQKNWNSIIRIRGYYAIVEGKGIPKKGTIHTWLQETKTHLVYSGKGKEGKEAITHYEVLKEGKDTTLLNIHLDTGRKNQIRVHMKELGHPILGDAKYGNQKTFPRLALHAYHLEFVHPKTKKNISLKLEMPICFQNYLNK